MTDQQDIKQWFSQKVKVEMDALYGVALRLTANSANAEDLVAETVIKAWSCIDKLEDRKKWRPWVFRILRNEFISNYRKQSIRPIETSYDEQPGDEADSIASMLIEQPDEFLSWWACPEHEYINGLLGEQIRDAINQLPNVFRMTIILINVEGLSYDETSVVLGIPRGTVRSRMKRGRTLLQKALWLQALETGITAGENGIISKSGA